MKALGAVVRVTAMCLLGAAGLLDILFALVIAVGGSVMMVMSAPIADAAGELSKDPAKKDEVDAKMSEAKRTVGTLAVQIGALGIAAMVTIAYVSNRAKLVGPIAGVLTAGGHTALGASIGFGWYTGMGIAGGALAVIGWYLLRTGPPEGPPAPATI